MRTNFPVFYDAETGIVTITLRPENWARRHLRRLPGAWLRRRWRLHGVEVAPGWIVRFDRAGLAVSVEILDPLLVFPAEVLRLLPPEFDEP